MYVFFLFCVSALMPSSPPDAQWRSCAVVLTPRYYVAVAVAPVSTLRAAVLLCSQTLCAPQTVANTNMLQLLSVHMCCFLYVTVSCR